MRAWYNSCMNYVLYINGVGSGKISPPLRLFFDQLERRGVKIIPAHINWYADESFDQLRAKVRKQAQNLIATHNQITIAGASAGVALALNAFASLSKAQQNKTRVVCICGPVSDPKLPWWDKRTLNYRTHRLGRNLENHFASVKECEANTIPQLTLKQKQQITVVKQLLDFVVPRKSMNIKGVKTVKVYAIDHVPGILAGLKKLPKLLPKETLVPSIFRS